MGARAVLLAPRRAANGSPRPVRCTSHRAFSARHCTGGAPFMDGRIALCLWPRPQRQAHSRAKAQAQWLEEIALILAPARRLNGRGKWPIFSISAAIFPPSTSSASPPSRPRPRAPATGETDQMRRGSILPSTGAGSSLGAWSGDGPSAAATSSAAVCEDCLMKRLHACGGQATDPASHLRYRTRTGPHLGYPPRDWGAGFVPVICGTFSLAPLSICKTLCVLAAGR